MMFHIIILEQEFTFKICQLLFVYGNFKSNCLRRMPVRLSNLLGMNWIQISIMFAYIVFSHTTGNPVPD